jgi:hypothetical protein
MKTVNKRENGIVSDLLTAYHKIIVKFCNRNPEEKQFSRNNLLGELL